MAVTVALGNVAPVDYLTDPETGKKTKYTYPGLRHTVTEVTVQPDDLFSQMRDVLNIWAQMSDAPPSWVTAPGAPMLEAVLRDNFKGKQPEGWTGEPAEDWAFDIDPEHDSVLGRIKVEEALEVPGESPEAAALSPEDLPAEVAPDPAPEAPAEVAPDAPVEG